MGQEAQKVGELATGRQALAKADGSATEVAEAVKKTKDKMRQLQQRLLTEKKPEEIKKLATELGQEAQKLGVLASGQHTLAKADKSATEVIEAVKKSEDKLRLLQQRLLTEQKQDEIKKLATELAYEAQKLGVLASGQLALAEIDKTSLETDTQLKEKLMQLRGVAGQIQQKGNISQVKELTPELIKLATEIDASLREKLSQSDGGLLARLMAEKSATELEQLSSLIEKLTKTNSKKRQQDLSSQIASLAHKISETNSRLVKDGAAQEITKRLKENLETKSNKLAQLKGALAKTKTPAELRELATAIADISGHLKKLNQGTSINGILRKDLLQYSIDLPPLPQQRTSLRDEEKQGPPC